MFNIHKLFAAVFAILLIADTNTFGMRPIDKTRKQATRARTWLEKRKISFADTASQPDDGNAARVINNPNELKTVLTQEAGSDTLVVFDCDGVLLKPDTKGGLMPMNDKIVEIVRNLQNRHIRVLVLSAVTHIGVRISGLKANGFHFENSWSGVKDCITDNPAICLKFSQGVMVSGNTPKGSALCAFCEYLEENHLDINFSKVIFVDDCEFNVNDVQQAAKSLGLSFIGVHYTEKNKRKEATTTGISIAKDDHGKDEDLSEQDDERGVDFDLSSVMPL